MNNQGESDRLILALKLVMRKNRVRHADLARALGLSIPTVKRTLSRGPLSVDRLMQICDTLGIGFYELVEIAKENAAEALSWMSNKQEEFLLKHPDATEYLIRMMNGATPEQIQAEVGLSAAQSLKYLVRLETSGLIMKVGTGYRVAPTVLRGARPGEKLNLDFARRCSGVVGSLVKEGLHFGPAGKVTGAKTVAIGFQLSEKSRKDLKQELQAVLSRFAAIERQEGRALPPSRLSPLTVVTCTGEMSLYLEAYRNSLRSK